MTTFNNIYYSGNNKYDYNINGIIRVAKMVTGRGKKISSDNIVLYRHKHLQYLF